LIDAVIEKVPVKRIRRILRRPIPNQPGVRAAAHPVPTVLQKRKNLVVAVTPVLAQDVYRNCFSKVIAVRLSGSLLASVVDLALIEGGMDLKSHCLIPGLVVTVDLEIIPGFPSLRLMNVSSWCSRRLLRTGRNRVSKPYRKSLYFSSVPSLLASIAMTNRSITQRLLISVGKNFLSAR